VTGVATTIARAAPALARALASEAVAALAEARATGGSCARRRAA
jgi:hypothetical protein